MAKTRRDPQGDTAQPQPYRPPQKLLVPCAACGCTVLRGVYTSLGHVKSYQPPVSPITGEAHNCQVALIQYAAHWQYVVALAPGGKR